MIDTKEIKNKAVLPGATKTLDKLRKRANKEIADVKKKIEVAKQKIESLKNKIKVIDEMDIVRIHARIFEFNSASMLFLRNADLKKRPYMKRPLLKMGSCTTKYGMQN